MIKISGSTRRSFLFPADIDATIDFFSDIGRILHYLPHISVVNKYSERGFRMLYRSKELGLYRINIYCDLTANLDPDQKTLKFSPLNDGVVPVKAKAGLYSLVSKGDYSSVSQFHSAADKTQIDYELNLASELPLPLGVQFMPSGMVEHIANNILQWRMQEIIEGFISRSLRAYHLLNQERI